MEPSTSPVNHLTWWMESLLWLSHQKSRQISIIMRWIHHSTARVKESSIFTALLRELKMQSHSALSTTPQYGKMTQIPTQELFEYLAREEFRPRVSEAEKCENCSWHFFAAQAMDSNGNLFFVLMNPIAIACWDTTTPYSIENIKIVLQNDSTLQFASGVKVIKNLLGQEELWIVTNRFQVNIRFNYSS